MNYTLLPMIKAAYNVNLNKRGDAIVSKIMDTIELEIKAENLNENEIKYSFSQLEDLVKNNDQLSKQLDNLIHLYSLKKH